MARFEGGWIKIHRSMVEGDIGQNPVCLALMVRLIAWANLYPSTVRFNGKPRECARGSLILGIRELAEKMGCAKQSAYRHLLYLEERDTIRREIGTEGTLISIVNFERYQSGVENLGRNRDATGTEGEREVGQDMTPIEERRERNKYAAGFEEVYELYPKKEGKSRGAKIYQRDIKTAEDRNSLIKAIKNYSAKKAGGDPKYLKQFSTFMGEWRDWIDRNTGTANVQPVYSINVKPVIVGGSNG